MKDGLILMFLFWLFLVFWPFTVLLPLTPEEIRAIRSIVDHQSPHEWR